MQPIRFVCRHLHHYLVFKKVRNTTKLKQVLLMYDIDLSMDDDGHMTMTIVNKTDGTLTSFQNTAYSWLINKAYSHMMKELKKTGK